MIKKALYLFCAVFLGGSLFFSCGEEYNDNEPPMVDVVQINDTFYLDFTYSARDSVAVSDRKRNLIKLRFTDNKALSSYIISLTPGSSFENPDEPINMGGRTEDSLAYTGVVNSRLKDIFGMDDISINDNLYIKSSFQVFNKESSTTKTYKTRSGKYTMLIKCVDKGGNETFAETKEVWLVYPPIN